MSCVGVRVGQVKAWWADLECWVEDRVGWFSDSEDWVKFFVSLDSELVEMGSGRVLVHDPEAGLCEHWIMIEDLSREEFMLGLAEATGFEELLEGGLG